MNPFLTWAVRLLGGFFPFITKPFSEWAGKMIFYAVISFAMLWVWGKVFPMKPTTRIETVETQIINECPKDNRIIGLSFNIWKLKLGVGI